MVQFVEKKRNRTCETPQSAMIVQPEGKNRRKSWRHPSGLANHAG